MEKQAWTIGESVVVKPGVSDPDPGRDIGGWQGRISGLFEGEGTVVIHWDRLTLKRMPLAHIAWCEEESLDWLAMTLAAEEVVPATARDTEEEVVQARRIIEFQTNWLCLGGEQSQRVQALVNQAEDKDDDYSVMQIWHTHLTKHLTCPFTATVIWWYVASEGGMLCVWIIPFGIRDLFIPNKEDLMCCLFMMARYHVERSAGAFD